MRKEKSAKEKILETISSNSKGQDIEWYKEQLKANGIPFVVAKGFSCEMVVPEFVFNKWSQAKQKKFYGGMR